MADADVSAAGTTRKAEDEAPPADGATQKRRKRRSGWDTPLVAPAVPASAPLATVASTSPIMTQQQELAAQQVALALAGAMAPPAAATSMPMMMGAVGQYGGGAAQFGGAAGVQAHILAAQRALSEDQEKRVKCRIYVGSLNYDLTDVEVQAIFGSFGQIRSCDMSKDPVTGKHKGFCFIEYTDPVSALNALTHMNGFELAGRPIKVGRPNSGTGSAQSAYAPAAAAAASPYGPGASHSAGMTPVAGSLMAAAAPAAAAAVPAPVLVGSTKLFVGNIDTGISADMIKQIFGPFGNVIGCELVPDPADATKHRGYGFIQFTHENMAAPAMKAMHDFELAGRKLRVNWASVQPRSQPLVPVEQQQQSVDIQAALAAAMGQPTPTAAVASPPQPSPPGSITPSITPAAAPAPTAAAATPVATAAAAAPALGAGGQGVSRCVMLKNLVPLEEANDEGLKGEIMEEVTQYGAVDQLEIHVHTDPASGEAGVRVFVLYSKPEEAASAIEKLEGRFFGGNVVQAALYDMDSFSAATYDR